MGDGLEHNPTAHGCLTGCVQLLLLLAIVALMTIVRVILLWLLLLLLRNNIRYERFESTHVRHRR